MLLIDVDGTLLSDGDKLVSNNIIEWINKAKQFLKLHLVSNNPSMKRIKRVADQLGIDYTYAAAKPSRKAIRNIVNMNTLSKTEIAIIGDRIFTDVLAGNRYGIYTILVKPITNNSNRLQLNILHKLEKVLSRFLGGF